MKNIYYSGLAGKALRQSGMILGLSLLFQTFLAAAIAPVIVDQQFSLPENAQNGTLVGAIAATDASSYYLVGGNESGAFALDVATGELTVSDSIPLDYEMNPSFTLTVEVRDAEGASSQAEVLIELEDVAEEPQASTGSVVDVTVAGVLVNGAFRDMGAETTAAVQYGTSEPLDNSFDPTGAQEQFVAQPGSGESSFQANLSGLTDGTTYYFRTVAKNSEGTAYGATGSFTTLSIPWVESIAIRDSNPTNASTVQFRLVFSEPVEGLDVSDFVLEINPEVGKTLTAVISGVSDSGDNTVYNITVSDVVGDGTLKLVFKDDDSVMSLAAGVPVGGEGTGNGDFENGEVYTIDQTEPAIVPSVYVDENDGTDPVTPATYSFSLNDLPNDSDGLTVIFDSFNEALIPDENYEFVGSGSNRRIKMYPVAYGYGQATVEIIVEDEAGNQGDPVTLNVIVRAVANGPLLIANHVEGDEDTIIPLEVAARLKDKDGSETLEQIKISGVPAGATLSEGDFIGNGTYTFVDTVALKAAEFIPESNLSGVYELTLWATSRENELVDDLVTKRTNTASKTFTVTVKPVNDEPVFALEMDDVQPLQEDFEPVEIGTIIPSAVPEDEQNQTVAYSVAVKNEGESAIATFSVIDVEGGVLRLRAESIADAFGSQVFTVTANDGQAANNLFTQDFTLTVNPVNDAPAFTLSQEQVVKQEDFAGTEVISVTDNSPENEGEAITYSLSPASVDFADVSINATTGEITISAVADGFGSETFTVTAFDGELRAEQSFDLIVNPVNDEPAFTLSQDEVVKQEDFEGTEVINVTDNSPENEGEAITYSLSPASVDFADVSINATTGEITISAVADGFGSETFTVTAFDGELRAEQSFDLIVNPVNDEPAFTLSQDEVVKQEDFEGTEVINVTDNSPENEGEAITYSLSPATVDFADVSINAATGTITIEAVPDYYGGQTFTVIADDGELTASREFTLTVNPVNDAPEFTLNRERVIVEEDFGTTENVAPTLVRPFPYGETEEEVTFSLNPASVDFANVSIDPATGEVTITAIQDMNGEQEFEIMATDNGTPEPASSVQTFLLRVVPVADEPVLTEGLPDQVINEDEAYAYTIPAGVFSDPDGDETLSFTATLSDGAALPAWLSFDAEARAFSGTPENPDVGTYSIEVVAEDPTGQTVSDDFALTVVPVNDAPVISEIADVSIVLGDEVPAISFTVSDEETSATELQVTATADNDILLPASAISISGEGEDRTLVLSPALEQYGVSVVTVTVSDGENSVEESFTFEVVFRELAIDVPTLITPNGDGANDTWNIRYLSLYENNAIRVFDRTGKLVFESANYLAGPEWDGTHGGNNLPQGVYLYQIRLNGGTLITKGTITIAR